MAEAKGSENLSGHATSAWGCSWHKTGSQEPASKVKLTQIMSEQLEESEVRNSNLDVTKTVQGDNVRDEDETLARALAESLRTTCPADTSLNIESLEDSDYALALQLQEEEEVSYYQLEKPVHSEGKVKTTSQLRMDLKSYFDYQEETIKLSAEDAPEKIKPFPTKTTRNRRKPIWITRDKSLKGQGGDKDIITKHDPIVCGRRNVENLSKDLSPNCKVGDLKRDHSLRMSNDVVNTLKRKLKKQEGTVKGLISKVDKDSKQTHSKGLDTRTRLVLQAFVNSGILDEVNGAVRTGKEAVVYHALGTNHGLQKALNPLYEINEPLCPREYAVKVFKTTLSEFKSRMEYINGDHRFAAYRNLSHQNPRKVVSVWCEKELKNLTRVHRAGIPSPRPIKLSDNILLMTFLGREGWASPQLKETKLSFKRYLYCYVEAALILRAMFIDCNLIHADFSEYNILYHGQRCHVIDFGQAVGKEHPEAEAFLQRDCENTLTFFRSKGLELIDAKNLIALVNGSFECEMNRDLQSESDMVQRAVKHANRLGAWSTKHRMIIPYLFKNCGNKHISD